MSKAIKSTLTLVAICAVMAVLLALTNALTAPIIEKNNNAAADGALLEVMPNGEGFEKMDTSTFDLPSTVTEVYKEKNGGYVIKLKTTGYQSDMEIMCGISRDKVVTGAVCLSSKETLGYEKSYGSSFIGKDAAGVADAPTVSGATKTTEGYKGAIKDALTAVDILGGASVDLRTEEEILQDNLESALPAGEGKFTKPFIAEVLEGIDAVYAAENGAGFVYVIGEEFIAVDASGATDNATVSAAHATLSASASSDIDLTAFEGLPALLVSAKKTESGNYIFEVNGEGFGIKGDPEYYPSGQYILVRVSMTPDGRIIDTLTVSQYETKKFGGACADEKFYGQFDGKTGETYTQIDAISGATFTTNGYLGAIEDAFEALSILEGGNNQ